MFSKRLGKGGWVYVRSQKVITEKQIISFVNDYVFEEKIEKSFDHGLTEIKFKRSLTI